MHNLTAHVKTSLLSTGVAVSGTSTDWNSAGLDGRGFEGVRYIASVNSTDTTGPNLHIEMSATSSDLGTWVDVADSAAYLTTGFTTGQADGILISDAYRPMYRWTRGYLDRATTGQLLNWMVSEQYRPGLAPTSASTAVNISDETIVVGSSGSATG